MCIIVDANQLGRFLAEPPDSDATPIRQWLDRSRGGGVLVYSTSGKFAKEIGPKARIKLANYARAGKARLVPADRLAEEEERLRTSGQLRSDDAHVLALARESRARVLFTADQDLIADFTDHRLITNPRGKVYSGAANADLLARSTCAAT